MRGTVGQRSLPPVTLLVLALVGGIAAAAGPGVDAAEPVHPSGAYVPVGPLRLADTRSVPCGCSRLDGSTIRVEVANRAGMPDEIIAAAVTVTATPTPTAGFVTTYPSGSSRPLASTLNTRHDRVTSNSTIVPVGGDGAIDLYQLVPGDLIVDVTGVFVGATVARAGRFVPVTPRRLVDTRDTTAVGPNGDLAVPLPAGVATDATAVAVNITSALETGQGHLSVRPAGTAPGSTSFMNPSGFGQAIAASVIVPVSEGGLIVRSLSGGHVIVDFTGWFTGPGARESDVGLFQPLTPDRRLDTRITGGRLQARGTIELPIGIDDAAAVVTNVTVTRSDRAGFVTAYPAGTPRPTTSAVNPAFWEHTIANTAITRLSDRGVAFFSLAGTDLVVDVSGWFLGSPMAAATAPAPNDPTRSRALLMGDSTLAGIEVYRTSHDAFVGFDAVVDAASCRRLVRPSCRSSTTGLVPSTGVEAIRSAPGSFDYVVVKAGYNDWFSDFPGEFDAIVQAARAKGAHTILWFTQNEGVRRNTARRAYQENNADLRWLTTLPQYSDVLLADWLAYSGPRPDWFHDGTHVNRAGAYAITDYTARWIAAVEHRPCPRPWVVGGAVPNPCPPPELVGPVPDPVGVNS